MANHLKFCGCSSCMNGRHRGPRRTHEAKYANRRLRRAVKIALRQGREPPASVSVPYTD